MKTLRPGDIAALILAAFFFAAALFAVYGKPFSGALACIEGEGGKWIYPLDSEARAVIPGPLGDTVIAVQDGAAAILSSPCKNQTCVAAGAIRGRGQWAACLPNRVLVTIESAAPPQDASTDAGTW